MSTDPTNNDNDKLFREGSHEQQRHSAPARHGGRRRGGVGVEVPDDDDIQPCLSSELHPGGEAFRYVSTNMASKFVYKIKVRHSHANHVAFTFHLCWTSAMTIQSREPGLKRAEPEPGSDFKSPPKIVESNPRDSTSLPKSESHEEWNPLSIDEDVPSVSWHVESADIQQVPMYFPTSNLNFEFPAAELDDVLDRLAKLFRKLSIQANFRDRPLSAFLQTCENIEFYLVFFHERVTRRYPNSMDPKSRRVFISLQRHRGDQMIANQYFHELIDAAKGVGIEESSTKPILRRHRSALNAEELIQVERLKVRACEFPEDSAMKCRDVPSQYVARQTPNDMIISSVKQIYVWIQQPKRLDNRQHALEYLVFMTDLKRTMSSSAIAGALLVLQGSAPGMSLEAEEIQRFFLSILQRRALPGDRQMFEEMNLPSTDPDKDIVMRPYFPEESEETQGYHSFIIEYLNKLFHLALQVLVQALEVVECFQKQIVADGANILNMAMDFLFVASESADGKELHLTLLECIRRAESKHANAYLACKALRLLSLAYPPLKERLKLDDNARASIQNAYNIGKACHSLLMDESFRLWETVRQDGV
jgi:hypothetical protein